MRSQIEENYNSLTRRCRKDAFFFSLVLYCDFFSFFHIPCFWVFGSCLIRVGLLEYVRADGWLS